MTVLCDEDFIKRIKNFSRLSYTPGERSNPYSMDTHDLRYLNSGDFCANLHIHTLCSDGIMTIPEYISNIKKYPNILTAVTDHDTLEGVKEISKLYNNDFDTCFGIEISTVAIKFPKQPNPISIHLLVYGIDTADKDLNDFLDEKKYLKLKLAKSTIAELNEAIPGYNFTIEEASLCHPLITKGQDEVAHPLKKYTAGKILHQYYCPNANFSYAEPIFKYKYLFQGTEPYFISYKKALENFIQCSLPLIPDDIFNKINTAKSIYTKAHPQIGKMLDAFSSFEETVQFVSGLKHGIMSIAHPARYKAYTPLFYNYLFDTFKKYGKDKALCFEKYYQSYEGSYYIEWQDIINRAADGLTATGGLDSHGKDITYRSSHY